MLFKSRFLDIVGIDESVKLSKGQSKHHVQVVVGPLLLKLLFDLVEDFFALQLLESGDLLQGLADEVHKGVVET